MSWSQGIRQSHRWLSIAFTLTVVLNLAVMGQEEPALWISFLPLLPLTFLMFSGLYLFVLPHATRWRSGRRTHGSIGPDRNHA